MNIDKCYEFMKAYIGERPTDQNRVMHSLFKDNFNNSKVNPGKSFQALLKTIAECGLPAQTLPHQQWIWMIFGIVIAQASETEELKLATQAFREEHYKRSQK